MDDSVSETTQQALFAFIRERFPVAGSQELTAETPLLESGIVDSLGILDLVAFIEESYGIAADDDDLVPENFQSVDALTRYIEQRR